MDNVKLFEEISPLIHEYLWRFVLYLVRDEDLAKDIHQETLILIWQHIDQLQDEEKILAWARTIATRTATKAFKKRRKFRDKIFNVRDEHLDFMGGTESAEDTAIRRQEIREAQEYLNKLDPKSKRIFIMHGEFDMTFQEIGKFMDIPPETAKTKYYRALARYRKDRGIE